MKKIGLICMALVLALGVMGAGLAFWNETLTISGTVATGELDIEFTECTCSDTDTDMANGGEVVCDLTDDGDTEPTGSLADMSKATITISNAYPSYTATCLLTVHNNGTIPAKVKLVEVSCDTQLTVSYSLDSSSYTPGTWVDLAVSESKVFDIVVHVNDTAEELSTYTFSAQVIGNQFNDS